MNLLFTLGGGCSFLGLAFLLLLLRLVGVLLCQWLRTLDRFAVQEPGLLRVPLKFVVDGCHKTVTFAAHQTDLEAIEVG